MSNKRKAPAQLCNKCGKFKGGAESGRGDPVADTLKELATIQEEEEQKGLAKKKNKKVRWSPQVPDDASDDDDTNLLGIYGYMLNELGRRPKPTQEAEIFHGGEGLPLPPQGPFIAAAAELGKKENFVSQEDLKKNIYMDRREQNNMSVSE